jgi:hypothetical protein
MVGWAASGQPAIKVENAHQIRPYADNPWYWQYHGKPVL